MNYKKDNFNKHNTEKQSSSHSNSYKQDINESKVFSKRQIEFMIKRLEKLSSAIYIVTDLVSDNEPLKWKLRQTSLSLLSDTSGYKLNISENVYKMVSFLDIALAGNIVSEMNGNVLKHEFEGLIKGMENIKKEDTIGRLFLYEKNEVEILERRNSQGHQGLASVNIKGHLSTNVLYKTNNDTNDTNTADKPKGHGGLASVELGGSFVALDNVKLKSKNDKQGRRLTILDTVKKKKEITVRDIALLISSCSEKTLQRELVSMVKDKILKKTGEKRWSKYSLL